MGARFLLALLAATAAAAPAAAQAPPTAAIAPQDWSQTIGRTPEGGFRMGNPDARVKLVQYSSITCGHCGSFVIDGAGPLAADYVSNGEVSWEYRPFLIFPSDEPIFKLLLCGSADRFFPRAAHLYAIQSDWSGRLDSLTQDEAEALESLQYDDPRAHAAAIVRTTQLDRFFRDNGMSDADIEACLGDEAISRQLADSTERGNSDGVNGTPYFLINGVAQEGHDWAAIEPALRAALSAR